MAQGLSSVETSYSSVYPRPVRRQGGSASIAWLVSLLLHGVLFGWLWHVVYQEVQAPRRLIIPEARLAPPGAALGEVTSSGSGSPGPEPAGPSPARLEPGAALPESALPPLPALPDVLPVIAAPTGDAPAISSSFVSAAVSGAVAVGGKSGSGGDGGGGAAAFSRAGPMTAFFGQGGNAYRVVYVVDASASLSYYMKDVIEQMRQSISDLIPTQMFHIIITADRQVREFAPRRLVPANAQYKREAGAFLDGVQSGGRADPLEAMRRAFAVRPELIYFLTDGDYEQFNIDEGLEKTLVQLNAGGAVTITSISFDPAPRSVDLLKRIARQHHGHFRLVQFKD